MSNTKISEMKFFGNTMSCNRQMHSIFDLANSATDTDLPILITGESGTGKSMLAEQIHNKSARQGSFISENCAAFTESLLESELFGHTKGSFTGATTNKSGLLQLADNGTLFLDEVGDMSLAMQSKLLCALEKRAVRKIGSPLWEKANFRLICATNRSLSEMVKNGLFREDLLYRLRGIELCLIPLRQRKEDILNLCRHFIENNDAAKKKNIHDIDKKAENTLLNCNWPGNIRQLSYELSRAIALKKEGRLIGYDDLSMDVKIYPKKSYRTLKEAVGEFENHYIEQTIHRTFGNKSKAANLLGISRRCLYYKLG